MKWFFSFGLIGFCFLIGVHSVEAADKVLHSPATATIVEGETQAFTLSLPEPVIIPDGGEDSLVIAVSSSSPLITVDPTSVSYTSANWFQNRTVNVTAVANTTFESDQYVTISMAVTTDSEFYSGYTKSFEVIYQNDDPFTGGGGALATQSDSDQNTSQTNTKKVEESVSEFCRESLLRSLELLRLRLGFLLSTNPTLKASLDELINSLRACLAQ